MKRLILVFCLFMIGLGSQAQDEYTIEIEGNVSGGNECGSIHGLREIDLEFETGPSRRIHTGGGGFTNTDFEFIETFNASNKVTRIRVYSIAQRKKNAGTDCASEKTERFLDIDIPCFDNQFSKNEFLDTRFSFLSHMNVSIYPNISIDFVEDEPKENTYVVCGNESIGIEANFSNLPNAIYNWEFYDTVNLETIEHRTLTSLRVNYERRRDEWLKNNCNSKPWNDRTQAEVCGRADIPYNNAKTAYFNYLNNNLPLTEDVPWWRPISNYVGLSSMNLKVTDLYTDADDQLAALSIPILIRVLSVCDENEETNTLTVQYNPEAPSISTPVITDPSCTGSVDGGFSIPFDRSIYDDETLAINLRKLPIGGTPLTNTGKGSLNETDYLTLVNSRYTIVGGENSNITNSHANYNTSSSRYTWDGGISAGQYVIIISGHLEDPKGDAVAFCKQFYYFFELKAPDPITFEIGEVTPSCSGRNNGTVTINSISGGGSGNFQYNRNNDGNWITIKRFPVEVRGLSEGTNKIKVRDAVLFCESKEETVAIKGLTPLVINGIALDNPKAPGSATGSITFEDISGGAPFVDAANGDSYYKYFLEWDNIAGDPNEKNGRLYPTSDPIKIEGLGTFGYSLMIEDSNGCNDSRRIKLTDPEPLTFKIVNTKNPSCFDADDGRLTIIAEGGIGTYSYTWKNLDNPSQNGTGNTIKGGGGAYNVVVTDSGGEARTEKNNIRFDNVPDNITLKAEVTPLKCFDDDMVVTLTAKGGSGNYEYALVTSGPILEADWKSYNTFYLDYTSGGYSFVARDSKSGVCQSDRAASGRIGQPKEIGILVNNKDIVDNTVFEGLEGAITISVVDVVAGYSVAWERDSKITTRTGTHISGLPAGDYVAIVTGGNGCKQRSRVIPVSEPKKLLAEVLGDNIACNNGTTILNSNVTGGSENYTYQWFKDGKPVGSSTTTLSNITVGTYRLVVNDGYTEAISKDRDITEPLVLSLSVTKTDVSCYEGADGTLILDPQGGTGPYYFSIDNKNTYVSQNDLVNLTIDGLISGDYNVWLRDANSCETDAAFNISITQPEGLVITPEEINPATTVGGHNGNIDITVSGGTTRTEDYRYAWTSLEDPSFNETTQDLVGIPKGSYKVVVLDANDCPKEREFTVEEPDPLEVKLEITSPILCHSAALGELNTAVKGGFPLESNASDFKYEWFLVNNTVEIAINTDLSLSALDALEAGTYKVVVTDIAGTKAETVLEITQPDDLVVTLASEPTHVNCFDEARGAIDVTVTGGPRDPDTGDYLAYAYSWSKVEDPNFSATTQDLENVTAGTYELVVIDDNLCTTSLAEAVVVTQPNAPLEIYNVVINNLTGYQTRNGSISLDVRGGTAPYKYQWINTDDTSYGATHQDIENIAIGHYELIVTDAKECSIPFSQHITEPDELEMNILPLALKEGIQCAGEETLSPLQTKTIGGVPPYTYVWYDIKDFTSVLSRDPQLSTMVTMGTYHVIVTDNNGNRDTNTYEVVEPSMLEITEHVTHLLCRGDEDGVINITVNGGVKPYTYSWSNGETTEDLDKLRAGKYTITVRDKNGCVTQTEIEVSQPPALFVSGNIERSYPSVSGASDGRITVNISGGKSPYIYQWRDANNSPQASWTNVLNNIGIETYGLTITDVNGCVLDIPNVDLFEPPVLEVRIEAVNVVSCFGNTNASITAIAEGGAPFNAAKQYEYQWFDADSNTPLGNDQFLLENIGAGHYYVVVSDAVNTTTIAVVFELEEPNLLEVKLEADFVFCGDGNDWTIHAPVKGGTAPYSYVWNDGSTGDKIENGIAGTYTVKITDIRGCSTTDQITVNAPAALAITSSLTIPTCYDGCDGTISIAVAGGSPPYTYLWNTGNITHTLLNSCAGVYSVTVKDSKQCEITREFILDNPEEFVIDLGEDITLCVDQSVLLDVTIDDSEAIYNWTSTNGFSSNKAIIEVDATGVYDVLVTNSKGCTASESIFVEATSNVISAKFIASTQVFVGEEFVIVDNSDPFPDTIEWVFPEEAVVSYQDKNYAELLFKTAGEYEITLITKRGLCIDSETKRIVVIDKEFNENPEDISFKDEIKTFDYSVYPNPSIRGNFNIDLELVEASAVNIKVFEMVNNVVLDSRVGDGNASYHFNYNLSSLPTGIYFILIETAKGSARVHKLIVK